jgi:hypothetical protein
MAYARHRIRLQRRRDRPAKMVRNQWPVQMAVREATDLTSSSFAHSTGRERENDSR